VDIPSWLNARLLSGLTVMLLAVVGGMLFLRWAQHTLPVYVTAGDLPSGTVLGQGDLAVVRVRMPAAQLRGYLRPGTGRSYVGEVLTVGLPRQTFLPAAFVLASAADADMVDAPIKVDGADMPQGLHPGDHVQVLAAYSDPTRKGNAVVLLDSVEVVALLRSTGGFTGTNQITGIEVRMPRDQAQQVASALANARIIVDRTPGPSPSPGGAAAPQGTSQGVQPPPASSAPGAPAAGIGTAPATAPATATTGASG